MNWTYVLIVVAVAVAFWLLRRMSQISAKAARSHLLQGALVVDVRSNAEFQAGHIRDAIHIPLEELEPLVARRIKDKDQVLLLHCQSGMRSEVARKRLAGLGYTHAFNLGSFNRAMRIVGEK